MSVESAAKRWVRNRTEEYPVVDRKSVGLGGVFLLICLGAIAIIEAVEASPAVALPEQNAAVAMGPAIVAILIVETFLIIGLFMLWSRVPEWVKHYLLRGLAVVLFAVNVWVLYATGDGAWIGPLVLALVAIVLWYRAGIWWIAHNTIAIVAGMGALALIASMFAPAVVIVAAVLLVAWDYVAVDLSSIMEWLLKSGFGGTLPNYLIVPDALTIDQSAVTEWVSSGGSGERPSGIKGIIGLGDFVIPGLIPVSMYASGLVNTTPMVVGSMVGVCVAFTFLVGVGERREGAAPGLPWLVSGAIAGLVISAIVMGLPSEPMVKI